jgi:hypothetical protein
LGSFSKDFIKVHSSMKNIDKIVAMIFCAAGNVEVRLRKALRKYYDKVWEIRLQEIKNELKQLKDFHFSDEKEERPTFKETPNSRYHYRDNIYRYMAYFDDPDMKLFENTDFSVELRKKFYSHFFKSYDHISKKTVLTFEFVTEDLPDFNDVMKKIEKETADQVNKENVINKEKKDLKEKEILKIDKHEALKRAVDELWKTGIIDEMKTYGFSYFKPKETTLSNEISFEIDKVVDMIATKWGIGPDELKEAFKNDSRVKPAIENESKLMEQEGVSFAEMKQSIVDTVKSRLPRFISKVVKDVPVFFLQARGTKSFSTSAYYKNRKIVVYWGSWKGSTRDRLKLMTNLGHEYWHAFEHLSGFKARIESIFQETVDEVAIGTLGQNAFEDFEKVIDVIDYFGGKDLSNLLKSFEARWSKGYFDKEYYSAIKIVKKELQNDNLYKEMGEILAETLAHIIVNDSVNAPIQSLVVWLNKKFSSEEKQNIRLGELKR